MFPAGPKGHTPADSLPGSPLADMSDGKAGAPPARDADGDAPMADGVPLRRSTRVRRTIFA